MASAIPLSRRIRASPPDMEALLSEESITFAIFLRAIVRSLRKRSLATSRQKFWLVTAKSK